MSTALLVGTTACSSDKSSGNSLATETTTNNKPTGTSLAAAPADITATQVVAGLSGAGYKCGNDGTYAICTSGPVAVWVLTGPHKRPPVVSLHSTGPVETATAAIAKNLPQALEIAHINPRTQITDWFSQQAGKTSAQLTAGDWQVEWSAEVDTEEPGAHLSLMDKLCKENCQAE